MVRYIVYMYKLSKVNVLKVSVAHGSGGWRRCGAVLTFRVFLLHGSMADAIPGWHSAKVPNHLSLPLLRKPQTPLLQPHPYDCIQASFPPQGPASRYHRHTLFGDCVFNIGILGSTLGTHSFLDSSLRPLPQSWNSLFPLSPSSNL